MSLIQWPFKRKEYTGIANPRYVSDVVSANEAIIDAIQSISGLSNPGFAIISGLVYDPVGLTYSTGIFYLNGAFYYSPAAFAVNLYLTGSTVDINSSPFPDSTSRPIYTTFVGGTSSSPTGASPQFTGNMNQYRIDLSTIKTNLTAVQAIIALLGNSAQLNVGTTPGTVAAGDYSYSKSQVNTMLAPVNAHQSVKGITLISGAGSGIGTRQDMAGMSITYTPKGTTAQILFFAPIQSLVTTQQFVIYINQDGNDILIETMTTYQQTFPVFLPYQIPVVAGTSTTIKISWMANSNFTQNGAIAPRILNIIDLP